MESKIKKLTEQEVPTRYQSRRAHIERDYQDEMEDEIERALRGQYVLPSEPAISSPSIVRVQMPVRQDQATELRPMPGQPRPAAPVRQPFQKPGKPYYNKPVRNAA